MFQVDFSLSSRCFTSKLTMHCVSKHMSFMQFNGRFIKKMYEWMGNNGDQDRDIVPKILGILAVPHQQLNEDVSFWNETQCYLTVCNYAQHISSVDTLLRQRHSFGLIWLCCCQVVVFFFTFFHGLRVCGCVHPGYAEAGCRSSCLYPLDATF